MIRGLFESRAPRVAATTCSIVSIGMSNPPLDAPCFVQISLLTGPGKVQTMGTSNPLLRCSWYRDSDRERRYA